MTTVNPQDVHPDLSGRTVLLIEDDEVMLRALGRAFQQAGCRVVGARDGDEGLVRFAERAPDLVITDMRMGGMDGLALFQAVNRKHPALPVIILTAHGNIPDAVTATLAANAPDDAQGDSTGEHTLRWEAQNQ